MSLPAGYYRIDPDIRALVAAMNVHGFRTYASCQGHGFPVTKLPPYIAFACPVKWLPFWSSDCGRMLNQQYHV